MIVSPVEIPRYLHGQCPPLDSGWLYLWRAHLQEPSYYEYDSLSPTGLGKALAMQRHSITYDLLCAPRKLRGNSTTSKHHHVDNAIQRYACVYRSLYLGATETLRPPSIMPLQSQSRRRPVSCRFCRTRKLRCDREVPCSSCTSRGIECEAERIAKPNPRTSVNLNPVTIGRARRLEGLLGRQNSELGSSQDGNLPFPAHHQGGQNLSPEIDHLNDDVAWLESIYNDKGSSVQFFVPTICNVFCSSNRHR